MADTWQAISGYASNNYSDTMVFEVDGATKKLQKISGQTLIAGEKNSQYIRFMMPRYWDGIDVSEKTISIIYGLAGQYYGETAAISAERTDDSLRFGWVVPEEACCIAGTLLFILVIKDSTYVLKSQITEVPVLKSINLDDVIPEPTRETWYADFQARVERTLSAAENAVEEAQSTLAQARSLIGSPLVANTAADMADTSRIYVYTGSETGYTNGHWYYHNGSAWTDGGVYNAVAVDTDTTLSISGKAADAKKTGDEISQIKEDLSAVFVTDSASGAVAHFVDGADNIPMKSVKVNIAPVQSGSGDPSPSNVRAISGWDSVKVTRSGRNFCKSAVTATRTNLNGLTVTPNGDGSITINGTATATTILYFNLATLSGNANGLQSNGMKNLPNGTYRFGTLPDGIRLQIYGSDASNAGASDAHFITDSTRGNFTISGFYQYNWVRLSVSNGAVFDNTVIYPAIYLVSDTEETYEPYNGNTYEISLSDAGTVYGGTLDVTSGELTVDKKMATIDGSNYALGVLSNVYNNRYCYRNTYLGGIIEKNLPSEITKACCNMLKSISRSNATSASSGIFQYHGDNDELRFLFPLEDAYSTPDKIYALGLECCIPLATPFTYQLSATEIKSLLGINNVWSDAGDMDVQYRADTKLYIDKRLGV